MAAPPGFPDPFSGAPVSEMSVAASVDTSVGAKAWAKSIWAPGSPAVERKNGVPTAPPWQLAPSALNGLAVQPDEIGARSGSLALPNLEFGTPVGVSSLKTGARAPPSKFPTNVTWTSAISSCQEMYGTLL